MSEAARGEYAPDPARPRARGIEPAHLLGMTRGFACVFWGLLTALVLFFANSSIAFFGTRIPAYAAGSALAAWGIFVLHDAGRVSRAWTRRSKAALCLLALQVYFAPFVAWWQARPDVTYLLVNWLCLLLTGMLGLFCINLLIAEGHRLLNAREGRMESLWFAASVAVLMIVPFFILVAGLVVSMLRRHTSLYAEMWSMMLRTPAWAYVVVAVPCALTLLATWKAKNRFRREFLAGS